MSTSKKSYNLGSAELGNENKGYVADSSDYSNGAVRPAPITDKSILAGEEASGDDENERVNWTNPVEFLMSCIAMSVGLGNIWRFPFTAYENGGGAFLIPYIIVLIVIGRPMYFLEMALGQFTSYSAVKVWSVTPALKGLGWGMVFATVAILSYYVSLMAITIFYFIASFNAQLPWAVCAEEWGEACFNSAGSGSANKTNYTGMKSSSELYFVKDVLQEKSQIDDGIGLPEWRLTICLFVSWVTVFLVIVKGVKSSGKAAYFLAIFPYVVLVTLLIRGCTLPGAVDGIVFFLKPQWSALLDPTVWYAAVTQAFFSLSVSFGSITMYSSYNSFTQNIHRDALIVTTLDTFTSLLAGCTIFSILGNLAYEMQVDDITQVVKGDTGLAFISYPDAIAKFEWCPQLFAVIFFLMLYTLGIGSSVALANAVISIVCDQFKSLKYWAVALVGCIGGFLFGLIYVTPGGQWILTLVDYYLVTFVIFVIAVGEIVAISWIYGFNKFCRDIQFMLDIKLKVYWRVCWGIVTPVVLIVILIYSLAIMEPKKYDNKYFPDIAYTIAWILAAFGIAQIPIWMVVEWVNRKDMPFWEMLSSSFRPSEKWGPKGDKRKKAWQEFKIRKSAEDKAKGGNILRRIYRKLSGFEETD